MIRINWFSVGSIYGIYIKFFPFNYLPSSSSANEASMYQFTFFFYACTTKTEIKSEQKKEFRTVISSKWKVHTKWPSSVIFFLKTTTNCWERYLWFLSQFVFPSFHGSSNTTTAPSTVGWCWQTLCASFMFIVNLFEKWKFNTYFFIKLTLIFYLLLLKDFSWNQKHYETLKMLCICYLPDETNC